MPDQAGIHGNTAKAALEKDVKLMNPAYTDFKQGINLYIWKLWKLAWDVQVDNKLYSLYSREGKNILPCLTHRDEVVLTQLRIDHTF